MTQETKKARVNKEIFKEPHNTDTITDGSDSCISTKNMYRFHILFTKKQTSRELEPGVFSI